MDKCKEATARVVVFREMNIVNSFTLECSFFGKEANLKTQSSEDVTKYGQQPKKEKMMHFSIPEYQSLGETLIQVMHNYLPSE